MVRLAPKGVRFKIWIFLYCIGAVAIGKESNNELGNNGSDFVYGIRPKERQKVMKR